MAPFILRALLCGQSVLCRTTFDWRNITVHEAVATTMISEALSHHEVIMWESKRKASTLAGLHFTQTQRGLAMDKDVMIGCDLHDATMVLRWADGQGPGKRLTFDTAARKEMIKHFQDLASCRGAKRIVFAYEASGLGFGLCDDLGEAGVECHVLAPTHLPHSVHSRKRKADD